MASGWRKVSRHFSCTLLTNRLSVRCQTHSQHFLRPLAVYLYPGLKESTTKEAYKRKSPLVGNFSVSIRASNRKDLSRENGKFCRNTSGNYLWIILGNLVVILRIFWIFWIIRSNKKLWINAFRQELPPK